MTTTNQYELDNLIVQGAATLATRHQLDEQAAEEAHAENQAALAAEWAPILARIRAAVPPWIAVQQPADAPRTWKTYNSTTELYRGVPLRLDGLAPIYVYAKHDGTVFFGVARAELAFDDDDGVWFARYVGAALLNQHEIPTETNLAVAANEAQYQAQMFAQRQQEADARNEAALARHIAQEEAAEAARQAAAQAEADRHARRAARYYREENNAVTLTRIADALEQIAATLDRDSLKESVLLYGS